MVLYSIKINGGCDLNDMLYDALRGVVDPIQTQAGGISVPYSSFTALGPNAPSPPSLLTAFGVYKAEIVRSIVRTLWRVRRTLDFKPMGV